jgi:enoyl-CoA hydratase/carnithine racemase
VSFQTITYAKSAAGVATITLNRPDVLNAFSIQMRDDLYAALSATRDDADVRVLVVRGAGRAFCAGADLREFGSAPSPTIARHVRFARDVWRVLDELEMPTIAALHGYAFGSGLELALFCDLRLAAQGTQLGLPESTLGMIPAAGGTQTLIPACGMAAALDLLLTGRRIGAEEALEIGLVSRVIPPEVLRAVVHDLSYSLAGREPLALKAVKHAVKHGRELRLGDGLALEARLAASVARRR